MIRTCRMYRSRKAGKELPYPRTCRNGVACREGRLCSKRLVRSAAVIFDAVVDPLIPRRAVLRQRPRVSRVLAHVIVSAVDQRDADLALTCGKHVHAGTSSGPIQHIREPRACEDCSQEIAPEASYEVRKRSPEADANAEDVISVNAVATCQTGEQFVEKGHVGVAAVVGVDIPSTIRFPRNRIREYSGHWCSLLESKGVAPPLDGARVGIKLIVPSENQR